ncbi:MAG: hypothetical protein O7B99_11875 [Planctomycetota bacterium]|nr:hypothetical protein [Planctomycetota bacterium]
MARKGRRERCCLPGAGEDIGVPDQLQGGNIDILADVARRKGDRLVVGFALETGDGIARAMRKLDSKGVDYIVLNHVAALGGERTTVTILGRDGSRRKLENRTKRAVARVLVRLEAPFPAR